MANTISMIAFAVRSLRWFCNSVAVPLKSSAKATVREEASRLSRKTKANDEPQQERRRDDTE